MSQKIVIWGVGNFGKKLFSVLDKKIVDCFIDNDKSKHGQIISGKKVISFEEYMTKENKPHIVIAVKDYKQILEQLRENNIVNYSLYTQKNFWAFYPQNTFIYNEYEEEESVKNEEEYIKRFEKFDREKYNSYVSDLKNADKLFNAVEIETYNRCNGGCSFCPVNVKNDTRVEAKMSETLFKKIIDELANLNFSGTLALFSNNEPFLDNRILEFHKYARERVKNARMHLFTNGSLLTVELLKEIMKYLDEIIIDNYNQELKLTPSSKKIYEYLQNHPELMFKVTIALRKSDEILTSRGGSAPNRKNIKNYLKDTCAYPFRQMIIRPDGKCSLCCNDSLGLTTMGDLSKNTMKEVWYGKAYQELREAIFQGRENVPHCINCDTFNW